MKLLAFDTATDCCSAALWQDGEILLRSALQPRAHAALLLPMIDDLLAEAGLRRSQLDAVAFGRGPGSFTGLRIAAGAAQGIAWGLDLPVAPVSSLAALAEGVPQPRVLALLDARLGEVYAGLYQRPSQAGQRAGLMRPAGDEQLTAPDRLRVADAATLCVAGPGWSAHEARLRSALGAAPAAVAGDALPRADAVARLGAALIAAGQGVPADAAQPVYLRDQVVRPA